MKHSRRLLREVQQRLDELQETVSGDGTALWFWCCHAEWVSYTDSKHREDCLMEGRGGLHDLVRRKYGFEARLKKLEMWAEVHDERESPHLPLLNRIKRLEEKKS